MPYKNNTSIVLSSQVHFSQDDVEALVGSFDGNVYGITLKSKDGSIYAPRVVKKLPGMHTGSVQCMTTTAAQTRARKYCGKRRTYEPKLFTGSFDTTVGHWLKATAEMKEVILGLFAICGRPKRNSQLA